MLGVAEWTAGYTLVAERFGAGRAFIAGDAAHLFTPTGGQGYNTSVDDVSNLGWKLAAACQGWGGPRLLPSYEAERKPIAHRNTSFARAMADSIGKVELPAALDEESAAGEAARTVLGERLYRHAATEFDVPGIHLGVFYAGSPVVVPDGSPVRDAVAGAVADAVDVVLTTGGTGISPTDRTPEATEPLLDRRLPGLADAIRSAAPEMRRNGPAIF